MLLPVLITQHRIHSRIGSSNPNITILIFIASLLVLKQTYLPIPIGCHSSHAQVTQVRAKLNKREGSSVLVRWITNSSPGQIQSVTIFRTRAAAKSQIATFPYKRTQYIDPDGVFGDVYEVAELVRNGETFTSTVSPPSNPASLAPNSNVLRALRVDGTPGWRPYNVERIQGHSTVARPDPDRYYIMSRGPADPAPRQHYIFTGAVMAATTLEVKIYGLYQPNANDLRVTVHGAENPIDFRLSNRPGWIEHAFTRPGGAAWGVQELNALVITLQSANVLEGNEVIKIDDIYVIARN